MAGEWRDSRVANEVNILLGFAFKSADFATEPPGHRLVRGDNIKRNTLEWGDKTRYWRNVTPELERYNLRARDIVVGMDGSRVGENFARIAPEDLPALLVQRVACLRAREGIDQDFLRYLICNPDFTAYVKAVQTGTSIPHISGGQIGDYPIWLPPVDEQRAIAHILGALDDKLELNRRTNETLEAICRAIFKSWFVDFDPVHAKAAGRQPPGLDPATAALFPDSFEDSPLGPIPKGWRIGRLDDVLVLQRGFDLPATQRTAGIYPVVMASGPNGTHNECMARGPGVATGRSGLLGQVYYIPTDFWPLNTTLWVSEYKRSTPLFAFHLLRLLDFAAFNAGSAVPTLNRNHVHSLPVVIPKPEVILSFDRITMKLMGAHRAWIDESHTLTTLRDALLPKLLSGEIRVKDAERLVEADV